MSMNQFPPTFWQWSRSQFIISASIGVSVQVFLCCCAGWAEVAPADDLPSVLFGGCFHCVWAGFDHVQGGFVALVAGEDEYFANHDLSLSQL